jgi:competence protein ComEC
MEHARSKLIDTIFFSVLLGFASGIVLDAFVTLSAPMQICIGAVAFALFFFKKLKVFAVGMFLLAALLGAYRSELAKPNAERFRDSIGEKVSVEGIIVDEPAEKGYSTNFTLDAGDVSMSVAAKEPGLIAYGDKVTATGTLELPENFMTDQGNEFDYISYLYKDNILYKLKNAKVTVRSHGHGNWVVAKLIPVKNAVLRSFHRVLPAKEADLLAGLNLGEKSNIDDEFRNDLVNTGTIHMIALSGANVTVIANTMRDFFVDILRLSARLAAWSGAVCIILFVTMTGLQSSAVRAGIMALIAIFARGKGRTYDAFRALMFSGFLMLLWDPKYLVYDTSFQLSFLATLGIIFITPMLERSFTRVPQKILWVIPLREALSVTLGAQLSVLPFILYKMGTLSIISLPANILVLPPVPLAMGLGALAGLIGSFSTMLAQPFSFVTYIILRYITGTIKFFAKVPYGSFVLHEFPLWLCLVMYGVLLWFVFRSWRGYSEQN